MNKPALLVHGMHGLGDNPHQRAVLQRVAFAYGRDQVLLPLQGRLDRRTVGRTEQ